MKRKNSFLKNIFVATALLVGGSAFAIVIGGGGGDTTAPVWENSTPSQNSVSDTQVVINLDIDEAGRAYAVVVTNDDAAPTSANVKAGQANGGGGAISSGSMTITNSPYSKTITLTGLSAGTNYDVYVVAEDYDINIQASAVKIDISTASTPSFDAGDTNTLSVAEDSGATDIKDNLIVTDTDVADTLTWTQSLAPSHGTLSFSSATVGAGTSVTSGGTITYEPTTNYNGADSFDVQVSDGTYTDTITINVTVSAVNDASTDISLDSQSVNQSGGTNAVVGNLTTTDIDSGDSFTYTLVSGSGDTNNGLFNINSAELRANDTSGLSAGTYSVRVNTNDGTTDFEKIFTITVVDDALLVLSSLSPANNATNVSIDGNLVMTLSKDAVAQTGDILLKTTIGDTLIETIAVGDARVTTSGSVITINPTTTLNMNTQYYVIVPNAAFDDGAGHDFTGVTTTTSWSFKTISGILSTLPTLEVDKGSRNYSTKATYSTQDGNSLKYMYSNTSIDTPNYGDDTPIGAINYTSGDDILSAEVGINLIIYEVDGDGKIVGFRQQILTTDDIKIPTPLSGNITLLPIPDILVDINSSKFVIDNNQSNEYNLSQYFTNASSYSYILTDTNTSVNWLTINLSTDSLNLDSNIVENNTTLVDTKHFIKITGSNSDTNISTYFTLRFKDLNASLAQYMEGNVTLDGVTETPISQQDDGDGRIYDGKNFITADLNITTKVYEDGGARHEIEGKAIAESKLPDSKIKISSNGDINTSATTINSDGKKVDIEVLAYADDTIVASHKLKVDGIDTSAVSNILNTTTLIKDTRVVETNATVSGISISIQALPDGKAEHTVTVGGKTSKISIEMAGGQTVIDSQGEVTTNYTAPIGNTVINAVTRKDGKVNVSRDGVSMIEGDFGEGSEVRIGSNGYFLGISTPSLPTDKEYIIK